MDKPMLEPGEETVATFCPAFRVYLVKILFVAFLTTIALSGFKFGPEPWITLALVPVVMAFYIVALEDPLEWIRRRGDVWTLTTQRLHFANPREAISHASINLSRIKRVGHWMFWALRLTLDTGDIVTLSFLPERHRVRAKLQAAIATRARVVP